MKPSGRSSSPPAPTLGIGNDFLPARRNFLSLTFFDDHNQPSTATLANRFSQSAFKNRQVSITHSATSKWLANVACRVPTRIDRAQDNSKTSTRQIQEHPRGSKICTTPARSYLLPHSNDKLSAKYANSLALLVFVSAVTRVLISAAAPWRYTPIASATRHSHPRPHHLAPDNTLFDDWKFTPSMAFLEGFLLSVFLGPLGVISGLG
jgi:hypothetical protein